MKAARVALATLALTGAVSSAQASDYGCRVLLCLAAVGGTPGECVPTLNQLWKDLAKGRGFPSCAMASGSAARPILQDILNNNPEMTGESRNALLNVMNNLKDSYARQGYSYYDLCPEGTSALPDGEYAIQGATVPKTSRFGSYRGDYYVGIGSGDNIGWGGYDYERSLGAKVCVANKVGETRISISDGYRSRSYNTGVYERVVLLNPANSPRIIDVYINDTLTRRVRW